MGANLKKGRPCGYDESIVTEILERLASGEMLRAICASDEKYPGSSTMRMWIVDDLHGLSQRYTRARELGVHEIIDECVAISDDSSRDTTTNSRGEAIPDSEWIARSRLRVDTRKWLASKIVPKIYGEKLDASVTHEAGDSLVSLLGRIRGN